MKRRNMILTGLLFVFTSATLSAAEISAEVKKTLDESLENWVALFNGHDAKSLGKEYTRDAEVIMPTGERLAGRAAIEKGFAETFAKNPHVRIKLSDVSRRLLTPRIVIEDGKWEESGHSEVGLPKNGLYTAILVKRQGRWLSKHEVGFVAIPMPKEGK